MPERTGKSRSELGCRVQFAEAYPTEAELSTIVDSFSSWTDLRSSLKQCKDADDKAPRPPHSG